MIILKNISKSFDNRASYAVKQVSFSINDGETIVLLGSSGCGKTTLLNLINYSIRPTSGIIEIDGQVIEHYQELQLRRSMGFVFQNTGLFPHMTVAKNIAIMMRLMQIPKQQQRNLVNDLLHSVNLDPDKFSGRYPDELSGGEQQRVGVARALATNPKYILMDEPFAALDSITRETLQNELIHLKQKFKKTIIFVTHDIAEALRLADRIVIMRGGQIEQIGTQDEVMNNPKTDFVKQLVKNQSGIRL
jgi:osmoprotectant transport system ATP-binding protein